jgi:NADH-quinone oxidoreductase subunit E
MTAAQEQLEQIFQDYPATRREHLIPLLQAVQDRLGFLSQESMIEIGRRLRVPTSKVFGVATFYNQFRFQPRGRVHCQVCRGTACHVKGSAGVLDAVCERYRVEPGQTTRDGAFSLEVVACLGACGLSPVVTLNGEFHAMMSAGEVLKLINEYGKAEATHVSNR